MDVKESAIFGISVGSASGLIAKYSDAGDIDSLESVVKILEGANVELAEDDITVRVHRGIIIVVKDEIQRIKTVKERLN